MQTQAFGFPVETLVIFFVVVLFSLAVDLWLHKDKTDNTLLDAGLWSAFWIGLALAFYGYLILRFNQHWADLYLAGYVLEKSLSVDNLMVFMAIFAAFNIKGGLQRRILYWGIVGALVLRALFVIVGVKLLLIAPWVGFIFALFIIWTAISMLTMEEQDDDLVDYSEHWSVKLTQRFIPIYPRLHKRHLIISNKVAGCLTHTEKTESDPPVSFAKDASFLVTPAFLCLVVIEVSDIAFAFDSVPAVIAVTQEPLLVYAAMIFAILGLRSLYFLLSALTQYLVYLEKAVVLLLFFIGFKMALHSWNTVIGESGIHISATLSLWIVLGILAMGILASLLLPKKRVKKS